MSWNMEYPKGTQPALAEIARYIASPLWQNFCVYLEAAYHILPQVEYSACSGAPGWNVKYKKGGRSLCTLYPREGFFTALVCIGGREQMEAELLLPCCCAYVQELYKSVKPFNGSRWLMIDVSDEAILKDTELLVATRAGRKVVRQPVKNRREPL